MEHRLWRTEPNGTSTSAAGEFRLVVREMDGCARFLVLRCPKGAADDPHTIAASGTEDDVDAAMTGAERTAARLTTQASRTDRLRGDAMPGRQW